MMVLGAAALSLAFATVAVADTIYLKNGRVIRSSSVRVEQTGSLDPERLRPCLAEGAP